ncbi:MULTISPECIES: major capsid protein [Pseudomonas]|uniref:major capsid protein n=1 Tax=Pseudomonas TaxID=286 RepID=UPI0016486256|nr:MULTISPECIES: major capsid protein [Pseudomonas]MBC3479948.1 major capsid protein [Pseudomonas sp. SWRI77]GLO24179.1 minor capsid protein E [Pseudomonas putida]HDS0967746.1 major capsid protein [Pseudomonas putida]
MAEIAIFEDDAFGVAALTAAINEQEYVPGRLAALGLFEEEGVSTLTVQIEKDGDKLALVPSGERGTSGLVVGGSKRILLPFNTVHLPQRFSIRADEIQGIRAFGTQTELQAVQDVVNRRLGKARRQLDATHEFHRMGAINGKVLDADGSTVLLDIFERFGVSRQSMSMGLNDPDSNVQVQSVEALDMQEDALGAATTSGARAFCGKTFWKKLIAHGSVVETYKGSQQAAALRGDGREAFEFGGIAWERYRGKVGGVSFIADDEARLVPEGVPELFLSVYAPADYMETVNTEGLPYYSKLEVMPFGKGVEGEAQSNPLHICTRPRAIIRLTL